jgi:hypothetical protein
LVRIAEIRGSTRPNARISPNAFGAQRSRQLNANPFGAYSVRSKGA